MVQFSGSMFVKKAINTCRPRGLYQGHIAACYKVNSFLLPIATQIAYTLVATLIQQAVGLVIDNGHVLEQEVWPQVY